MWIIETGLFVSAWPPLAEVSGGECVVAAACRAALGWHFLALQQMHCCASCDPPAAAGQPGSSGRPPCFRGVGAVFSIPPDPSWQLLEEENNIRAQRSRPWLPVVVTAGWNRRCCLLQPGNRYLGTVVYPHPSPPPPSPPPEPTMLNFFLYCLKYITF